ncbi:MAG: hypothetical protein PHD48_11750 [Alphaproteobacteria bacterium]|nr:hypothetical protein [Alphaproteobacteria bacterium]
MLLALECSNFKKDTFLAGFVLVRPIPDHVHIQRAALYGLQKIVLGLLDCFKLGFQLLDLPFVQTAVLGDFGAKVIQKPFQIFSRADLLPEGIQNQFLQLVGWNVA